MAKMRIYVVDIESVPSRYTCEWKDHVPTLLRNEVEARGLDIEVINISGGESSIEATPGAFLNFQQTNIYKNTQLNDIAARFTSEIKPGDKFLFTDAWNTGILQLKYMSELLNVPVEIHGFWHAGAYDKNDHLGRLVNDKRWAYSTERALYHSIDYNWFATDFHLQLFSDMLLNGVRVKLYNTGWPMEYMPSLFGKYDITQKDDIIIFPHRIAPEKQPEIFRDLAKSMPQYKFVVCQDEKLSKEEYHKILAKSKLLFSANKQETLGITIGAEGPLLDVIPYAPNRLSYSEMFKDHQELLYPSEWTEDWDSYILNKQQLINKLTHIMDNYEQYLAIVQGYVSTAYPLYFEAGPLLSKLITHPNK